MLAARPVVDAAANVPVVVVRVFVVVDIRAQAHVGSAESVDHVAKRDEVHRDVSIEREPGDLADLVLRGLSPTIASRVLRRYAADDVGVRNLVRGIYLVGPGPA